MKIHEITRNILEAAPMPAAAPVQPAQEPTVLPAVQEPAVQDPAVEAEPTVKDVQDVQQLLGTIDVTKEKPESLLNKLTGWMRSHPLLDKVTDIIPQTRLVKAIAAAADALESGDKMSALNSLASGLTGNVGKAVSTLARGANTVSALAQGDVKGAALAAGGTAANIAKGAAAVNTLAQGGTVTQAAQQLGGTAAKVAKGAEFVQNKLAPTAAPATATAPDELERIKQLSKA